jgi:hypothetical protein
MLYYKFFQIGSPTGLAPLAFSADFASGGYCNGPSYFSRLKNAVFPSGFHFVYKLN